MILREHRDYYQTRLTPGTIRFGDVEADAHIYTEEKERATRTLLDTADYCRACGAHLEARVPDHQQLIHESTVQ